MQRARQRKRSKVMPVAQPKRRVSDAVGTEHKIAPTLCFDDFQGLTAVKLAIAHTRWAAQTKHTDRAVRGARMQAARRV